MSAQKQIAEIMTVLRTATEHISANRLVRHYEDWLKREKEAGRISSEDYQAAIAYMTLCK